MATLHYTSEKEARTLPDAARFLDTVHQLRSTEKPFFKPTEEIFVCRAPGRLDLMGGNDDYTGGLVFEATIKEAVLVAVQARDDSSVVLYNPEVAALGWHERVELPIGELFDGGTLRPASHLRAWCEADEKKAWAAYILGTFYYLIAKHQDRIQNKGLSLYMESDIPLGKGVSSSAAIEVAPMKAMAARYGMEMKGVDLALATQWVEIALTGAACGVMDQLAVAMGGEDAFIPMLCQPCLPEERVRLPKNLRVWALDSGVRHSVAGIEYEAARAATFMGYRYLLEAEHLEARLDETGVVSRYVDDLWDGYLARLSVSLFREKYEHLLPKQEVGRDFLAKYPEHLDPHTRVLEEITYPVYGSTRYAVEENWRVHLFRELIVSAGETIGRGAAQELGEIMYQSHDGYTDCGLASDATNLIVNLVRAEKEHDLIGAKITGGGAGGTVAILAYNTAKAEAAFNRVVEQYNTQSGLESYTFSGSSPGADDFGVVRL